MSLSSKKPNETVTEQAKGKSAPGISAVGIGLFVILLGCVMWAYWPGLLEIFDAWNRDPDYSHGYLVAPLALFFLWSRRGLLDAGRLSPSWVGLAVLAAVAVIRFCSGYFFLGPIDAWTLPLSVAGVVMLVFGWHCLAWAWTSIFFLYFMIPIPYSAETWLGVPLQGIATRLSTEALQFVGQPAISEGNTIWVEGLTSPLNVADACSGLRILVGVFALAFAYVLFTRWEWWQKLLVLGAAVPVALVANSLRIVATGLISKHVSSEAAYRFTHDFAGLVMIPVAATMFWLFLVYLEALFPRVQAVTPMAAVASNANSNQK